MGHELIQSQNGASPKRADKWPDPPAEEAFHGLAGEFVRTIEPISEADPAALLGQFLAAFGNAAGRSPHYLVENDHHGAGLYIAIVGRTSKGRKGVAWRRVRQVCDLADRIWLQDRVVGGSARARA